MVDAETSGTYDKHAPSGSVLVEEEEEEEASLALSHWHFIRRESQRVIEEKGRYGPK